MSQEPDLGRRARKILQAVVSEYLHSGDAVGSRTITRRHDVGLSSATVRNVMADLEDLGLLEQRHSSAGRVPTPSGLRFFIDALLKVRGLTPKEKDEIRARVTGATSDEVVQRASRLLSEITQHASVILTPDPALQRFGHLEFVPLKNGKLLAILVTHDGRIENRMIAFDASVDSPRWERIHNYLNQLLSGMTLDEARERVLRELGEDKHRFDTEVAQALKLGQALFVEVTERSAEVVVSGHSNLVAPEEGIEPVRPARMRELLRALEDKQTLVQLLDRTRSADSVQVFLGAETALTALAGSSVVAMPYGPGETAIGALAVIGPLRMNYGRVISVVDFTADVVSQLLAEM